MLLPDVEDIPNENATSNSDILFEIKTDNYDYHSIFSTDEGVIALSIEHYTLLFVERYFVAIQYYDKINSDIIRDHAINDL